MSHSVGQNNIRLDDSCSPNHKIVSLNLDYQVAPIQGWQCLAVVQVRRVPHEPRNHQTSNLLSCHPCVVRVVVIE